MHAKLRASEKLSRVCRQLPACLNDPDSCSAIVCNGYQPHIAVATLCQRVGDAKRQRLLDMGVAERRQRLNRLGG